MKKLKTAVLLTGTGGRISQEVALIDQLRKRNLIHFDEDETFLAGFSSGAINIAAINACFRNEKPLQWESFYKEIFLANLDNDKFFIKTDPIHWDTKPLQQTFESFLETCDFQTISDLPFNVSFPVYSLNSLKTKWANSRLHKNKNILLTDLLMATTAIPVIFPSQRINGANNTPTGLPDGKYGDGAAGGIFKKFKRNIKDVVRRNGIFETLHVISPMREAEMDDYFNLVNFIQQNDLDDLIEEEVDIIKAIVNNWSMKSFILFLQKLHKENKRRPFAMTVYVSIPQMGQNFGILDFNNQIEKYNVVSNWVDQHPNEISIELSDFLIRHPLL